VVSHSSGEIAAAYAAGVLSFEEALGVAFYRGLLVEHRAMNALQGGMMAVRLDAQDVQEYIRKTLSGKVVVACINSSSSITISGDIEALDELGSLLENDAVPARRLNVPLAYHSHHMLTVAEKYQGLLDDLLQTKRSPQILFASPVTGGLISGDKSLDSRHWVQNLVSPVLFSEALESMVFGPGIPEKWHASGTRSTNVDVLLEIGAHSTLSSAIRETLGKENLPYISCLRRNINAVNTMQDVSCELVARGYPVSLAAVNILQGQTPSFIHDLPTYTWDHSTRYLVEPRQSRQNRYRRFLPHELLGSPVPGASSLNPTWRNFLRIQDLPWLSDHQLESEIVFPGAGYISLAIEAVRLLKTSSGVKEEPTSYRLRDVDIVNALMIPSDESGIEIVFTLRDCNEKELDYRGWYEFELCSISSGDAWIRHCVGYVSVEDHHARNINAHETPFQDMDNSKLGAGVKDIRPDEMFAQLRRLGIHHGPAFQNLIGSRVAAPASSTSLTLSPEALGKSADYVIHPTTLDSIFQTCYFSLPDSQRDILMIPKTIRSLTVPRQLGRHHGNKLNSSVKLLHCNRHGGWFKATVMPDIADEEFSNPLLMEVRLQSMQRESFNAEKVLHVHSQGRWEPDIFRDTLALTQASTKIVLSDIELSEERRYREVAYHLMAGALAQLDHDSSEGWQPHHKRYRDWMRKVVHSVNTGQFEHAVALRTREWLVRSDSAKASILDEVRASNAGGELLVKIGSHLAQIVRGDITPLELMVEDGLLERFYREYPQFSNNYQQLQTILKHFAITEPGAKVIEIGAGTGGATAYALEAFAAKDGGNSPSSLVGRYDFTDISADFFPQAKEKFARWDGRLSFAKLNIEDDPVRQGFAPGSYDLVIASKVLHATSSLSKTLTNVRRLLKPRGKLIFIEGIRHSIDLELIFGSLPGWWLGEEPERQWSAIADVVTWDKFLKSSGFGGVDADIGNCEQPEARVSSVLIATAVDKPHYPSSISIIWGPNAPFAWREELTGAVAAQTGIAPRHEVLEDVVPEGNTLYLCAMEMEYPLIGSMDHTDFEKVKSLLVNSKGIFWISAGGLIDASRPLWGLTPGLLRTFRREDMSKRCVHLDLEDSPAGLWGGETIGHILHILEERFNYSTEEAIVDSEYAVKNSVLHVLRYYPDDEMDLLCSKIEPMPEPRLWHDDERDLQYRIPNRPGNMLDEISFSEIPKDTDSVPYGMIEVEMKAFGLNFQDPMLVLGFVKDVPTLTHEGAGVVKRLGAGTEQSGLQLGDHVCGAFRGGFASTSTAWWTNVVKIPDQMLWEEAAAFPVAYLTVYVGLNHVARLGKGDRILIHSAAGGVGQAAIMWAQHIGADIFVTCGTELKRKFLIDTYGIPADHIFSSRNASFASEIMGRTSEQGVDVVLNSLGGHLLKASWECTAEFGHFVEIGKVDFHAGKFLDMTPFGKNITMSGVDLVAYSERKGSVIHDALVDLMGLYRSGKLKSLCPISRFAISEMGAAMKHMQEGVHMGKIVLTIGQEDIVNVTPRVPPLNLADMNVTHLIVGGTTGLGYAIAMKMIEMGAKNILAVSRHASKHSNKARLQESAKRHGCRIVVCDCDVSNQEQLTDTMCNLESLHMPPIGGVLQAAMVLDVSFGTFGRLWSFYTCLADLKTLGHGIGTYVLRAMADSSPTQGYRNSKPASESAGSPLLHHALVWYGSYRQRISSKLRSGQYFPGYSGTTPSTTRSTSNVHRSRSRQ